MDRRLLGKSGLQLVQRIINMRILAVATLLGMTMGMAFAASRPVVVELFTLAGLLRLPTSRRAASPPQGDGSWCSRPRSACVLFEQCRLDGSIFSPARD